MTLTIALKIMKMSAKALTKKFGSRAVGLSKRIKAGDVINKAKKGKLASKGSAKINRKGGLSQMARKTESPLGTGRKLTKKEIDKMKYEEAIRRGPNDMNRKRG